MPPIALIIPVIPIGLLFAAGVIGGFWIYAALLYMSVLVFVLDETPQFKLDSKANTQLADTLPVVIALGQFALLPLAVFALTRDVTGTFDKVLLFFAFSTFFGFVGTSTAHELIHRPKRPHFLLGRMMFISLLYGHHTSAHVHVHHRYVATNQDPNSAPLNMSFYRYWPRAWLGAFVKGYRQEHKRLQNVDNSHINPYFYYVLGALFCMLIAWFIGGIGGIVVYLLLAGHAQTQLLMTDYVQHYGLRRKELSTGKFEPVTDAHSWNAPHWFSAALTLQAPLHSEHHVKPLTPFTGLDPLASGAPQLPYSLPIMAALALSPKHWRRVMNPLAQKWSTS